LATSRLPLDVDDFLSRYWQREPLLLRGALPGFRPPISADELAGLALEDEVESRLVEEAGGGWRLNHGPFLEADFHRAPPWTLLVQAVDQYVPEVAELRTLVDFIPGWRADDIMVSYATDGGSVGPHFDHYDVFLLQGEGQRLWRLGQRCDHHSPLVKGTPLRILEQFDCQQEYLLEPGDILYVPPGLAHWGIARGECTTFSIGFRAPRRQDMLARLVDQALERAAPDQFLSDPGRLRAARPGELSAGDVRNARAQALALLEADTGGRWLGELVTEPRYAQPGGEVDEQVVAALLLGNLSLVREPGSVLAWMEQGDELLVFANGLSQSASPALRPLMEALCARGVANCNSVECADDEISDLIHFLLESGGAYADSSD
jgi:50S ribosomal protein L16 3-hydroxylase